MVRVCTDTSKINRQTVLLTCNTKYFISLLQKLVDLRAMVAGLLITTMKNVKNLLDFLRLSLCPVT